MDAGLRGRWYDSQVSTECRCSRIMSEKISGAKRGRGEDTLDGSKLPKQAKGHRDHLHPHTSSYSPDSPVAAAPQTSAGGSQLLSGGQWSCLASSELRTVSAASSGGVVDSDTAAALPAADNRRRSRKAAAPRRHLFSTGYR